jgi:uncharacterized membrane protein
VDAIFDWVCHRDPERCFPGFLFVCARCLGIYLGAFVGALWILGLWLARRRPEGRGWKLVGAAAVLATPLQVVAEAMGIHPGSNALRFGCGIFLGTGLAVAMGLSLGFRRIRNGAPLAWVWTIPWALLDGGIVAGIILTEPAAGMGRALVQSSAAFGLGILITGILSVVGQWGYSSIRKS